jgi:hypothetical protein
VTSEIKALINLTITAPRNGVPVTAVRERVGLPKSTANSIAHRDLKFSWNDFGRTPGFTIDRLDFDLVVDVRGFCYSQCRVRSIVIGKTAAVVRCFSSRFLCSQLRLHQFLINR